MGTGDYLCVTLRGGAPWGFTLREGEGGTYRPFLVSQVEDGGRAFLAGVQNGDEVVSLNGEPCADLTLLQANALVETSIECLQLLVKRVCSNPENLESEEANCESLKSTTLHIFSPKHAPRSPRELYVSDPHDEAYYGELDSEGPQLLWTQPNPTSDEAAIKEKDQKVERCVTPGDMVELQLSISKQHLDSVGCTSLGSAHGFEGRFANRAAVDTTTTTSPDVPCAAREPLSQHGVVLGSPSVPHQVEVILQQPAASAAGRGIPSVGGPWVSVGSQSGGEEGGGHCEGVPTFFSVSFGIPAEEAPEQDSDSEGDPEQPNKHRARHARLRRSESLSEKQVKEAKSKCKRIALLLTAAPPNPNNKGVLMFKKHRQRAKKYTLVSYGTGEDEVGYSGDEDDGGKEEIETVEFTLSAQKDSELHDDNLTNVHSSKGVLTINWDKGLLEIGRNLINQAEMECLPETKGKGALMFAQRRQRMDEISAEHEELRRQGIPVESVQEAAKHKVEPSYMQSTTEDHAYMDVNTQQQSQQQQQQYLQYQEQQYYQQQQQQYQQQQHYQQQCQQQYQQQQYEQQHYQQQMYQQQQDYHQQQQIQHYSVASKDTVQSQATEMQSSLSNRTAKPFSAQNMASTAYSPAISGVDQESVGQGEQIASRDERISTPAIRTGLLDSKRRSAGKPMFTFKEAPKVSPNPVLLNLLNRSDKKLGFESGPEEDYLSLGAEACNFLQSSRMKQKNPPPVAPKPVINPSSLPWSSQIEVVNQDMPQLAENSISTPAAAPTVETTASTELEPAAAPATESTAALAPQETLTSATTEEQHKWTPPVTEAQQQAREGNGEMNSSLQPESSMPTWAATQPQIQQQPSTISCSPAQVQPQALPPSQSPPQPTWVTRQPPPNQVQPQPPTSTWSPQVQTSWNQEQAQTQTHDQPPWAQPQVQPPSQSQTQVQPPWMNSQEPQQQQMQPAWGQPQELMQQQSQASWAQPPQADSHHQPPWVQQNQQPPQILPPWVQQIQPESQPQPPWVQQSQHQAPQQSWPQTHSQGQAQPHWDLAQSQPQQQQQQPSINAWPQSQAQTQSQPPWVQTPQAPPPAQPPAQPPARLNPWAPVPPQAPSQPSWAQNPSEQPMNSQQRSPWLQSAPPQPPPQANWQTANSQSTLDAWRPVQTKPQSPANIWAPQSQQTPINVAPSTVNTQPSPKPWLAPQAASQNRSPPPPPQRTNLFNVTQRASSPINPMATVLNPSSAGSAYEMPAVRGKGADMFAKRQSRMEKFVVDSETVQANKASRPTSPAASLPNEWKYTPNVRAPPPRAYNPIQSPLYPPAASKQPSSSSPSNKANKKGKDEQKKPAPKPLNVIDVMKHQPYQLSSSLFTYGPAAEAPKEPSPKPNCSPPNPPVENQPITYEQLAHTQPPFNASYPHQAYGMTMQPMMHDGHYQQNPNLYPPSSSYQQPPGGPYQQAYNQQYQQPAPPAYQPQTPQSPNPSYQSAQVPYQPASSPPYLAAPPVPYQQQPPMNVASFSAAARLEPTTGGNTGAAPKPKFTAKKSSAQVWKPTAVEKE